MIIERGLLPIADDERIGQEREVLEVRHERIGRGHRGQGNVVQPGLTGDIQATAGGEREVQLCGACSER